MHHNHLGTENSLLYPSFLELRNCGGNASKQLAQGIQWNSGATRESNPGHRAQIPSVLTARPLSHTSSSSNSSFYVSWLEVRGVWESVELDRKK